MIIPLLSMMRDGMSMPLFMNMATTTRRHFEEEETLRLPEAAWYHFT
jgi:hypothetical protein